MEREPLPEPELRARQHRPFPPQLAPLLDWATDLLAVSPASTIEVRSTLGLVRSVATASPGVIDHFLHTKFPNYVKGAHFAVPFADLLGHGMFHADDRLWSLQRMLTTYSSLRLLLRFLGHALRAHLRGNLLPFFDAAAGSGEAVDLQAVDIYTYNKLCTNYIEL
jgi:hypothetical protein